MDSIVVGSLGSGLKSSESRSATFGHRLTAVSCKANLVAQIVRGMVMGQLLSKFLNDPEGSRKLIGRIGLWAAFTMVAVTVVARVLLK